MPNLFVSCPHGFEETLYQELHSLGLHKLKKEFCGVSLPASIENVFTANYLSRVATRVLWPLGSFSCRRKEDLYREVRKIRWPDLFSSDKTFAIDANVHGHPTLRNSLFAALVVKDALCDTFRDATGKRPSVERRFPDIQLNLFISPQGLATLYLDTSGAPLHKRGWREEQGEASIHESLAAGLLMQAGYTGQETFCDPFAGSGTFLIEAALIATKTPPGFLRKKWGFFHLPAFHREEWLEWKRKQDIQKVPLPKGKIFGADKSREVTDLCRRHLKKLHLDLSIEVTPSEIAYYTPKVHPDLVITNPPYGKRLATEGDILFKQMELFAKEQMSTQERFFFLWPNEALLPIMHQHIAFKNGGLAVGLVSLSI